MDQVSDLLHDGPQNLIQLQGRSKRFAKLVKDSHFAGFPALGRKTRVATAFNAYKKLTFRHFRHFRLLNFARSRTPATDGKL
jgi:hypothetical protein